MKKFTISLAFLATVLGSYGCNKENATSEPVPMIPVVKCIDATRASGADKAEELLFSVPIKSDAGEEYTLEAWIGDTECGMPETKGTPITNGNLATVYGSFKTKAYCNDLSVYSGMKEATAACNGGDWSYDKTYKWPADNYCPLTFCSYAPVDANLNITLASGPKASFTYTVSGTDAQSQKDLLFAMDTQGPGTTGKININFHHALTSVKFIKGDIADCTISSISLVNFHDSGSAEFENGNWTWTPETSPKKYTQSFNTNVESVSDEGSLDPDTTNESRTFMVIPQNLAGNNAKIEISLGSSTITYDLSSASDSKVKDWSSYAGKTVTFKVNKKEPILDVVIVMDMSYSLMTTSKNYIINGVIGSQDKSIANLEKYCVSSLIDGLKKTGVSVSLIYFSGGSYSTSLPSSLGNVTDTRIINHFSDLMENSETLKSKINSSSFYYSTTNTWSSLDVALQEASYEFSEKGRAGSDRVVVVFSDFLYTRGEQGDGIVTGTYSFNRTYSGKGDNKHYYASDAVEKSKDLKDNGVRVYSVFCPCGEWVNTSTSTQAYKDMRSYARCISSDYPSATNYNDGETGQITNSTSYTYAIYLQDLDVLMGTVASNILN